MSPDRGKDGSLRARDDSGPRPARATERLAQRELMGTTNRPIQPLGGRKIEAHNL